LIGVDLICERIYNIHVSRYEYQYDQNLLVNLFSPRFFILVHGKYRHFIHNAMFAENLEIRSNHLMILELGGEIKVTACSMK
jgi:ribonuclease J